MLHAHAYRLPIRKYDPNCCFAVGDDAFDGLADEGIVIRQGAVAEGGKDGGEVLFPFVVLSAPLLHGLQALTEIVLFLHQGSPDTCMGITDACLSWLWSGSRNCRFMHPHNSFFYPFICAKL